MCLALLVGFIALIAGIAQPSVHYYFDSVGIRDAGTILASLSWSRVDIVTFLYKSLAHIEGPLQFIVLNAAYVVIGDILGLSPAATFLPNLVLTGIGAVFCYLIGRDLFSQKLGLLFAAAFTLMPWIGTTARAPWVFNLLTSVLELTTFYFTAQLLLKPYRLLWRMAAPASLAVYLTTAFDWPTFGIGLLALLWLNRKLALIWTNPFNLLPSLVFAFFVAWTIKLTLDGNPGYYHTLISYPFVRVFSAGREGFTGLTAGSWQSFWFSGIGAATILAPIGAWVTVRKYMSASTASVADHVLVATVIWLAVTFVWFLASGISEASYAYPGAVPASLLAAVALDRLTMRTVLPVVGAMALWQAYGASTHRTFAWTEDDRRVLAVATFLIEERPDLLGESKTAFLPFGVPTNVGQYARGRHARINFPPSYLLSRKPEDWKAILEDVVAAFEREGQLKADWLILVPELEDGPGWSFFKALRLNPGISWIARFQDNQGREAWLGETRPSGRALADISPISVDPLADRYADRYDRISFLSRNVDRIQHW